MAKPHIKLAESLKILKELQDKYGKAIKISEISKTHRERLAKNNFLKRVTRDWYIITNPDNPAGESTTWYTSFWKFCKRYLEDRHGQNYCLSSEQSLLLHAGCTTIPHQLIIRAPKASNTTIKLLHGTSLYMQKSNIDFDTKEDITTKLRVQTKEEAIIHMSPILFKKNPIEIRTVLATLKDPSNLLRLLLKGSHSVKAGRLVGALKNMNNDRAANEIQKTMEAADFKINVKDPFSDPMPASLNLRTSNPYVNRIKLIWQSMRNDVINNFPESEGISQNVDEYIQSIEAIYITDAYNSLSIENYVVSEKLIEKVRKGDWNLEDEDDQKHKDAMAARGYWQAHQAVKESIKKVFKGENSGNIFDLDHSEWYRQLFGPSVKVGLLRVQDLAGYRNEQVYISNSMHTPLNKDAVREAMPTLIEMLINEEHASVRSILGHFIFVYIHPYIDGNGRMGRFLMNLMLASGGYPWTVIPVERRKDYIQALDEASVKNNIVPFAKFISNLVQKSIEGHPEAKIKGGLK